MLHVYTASAGSGKTFTLVREYLRLALSGSEAYRAIQAVTFTNKATEEMKERILGELHLLAECPLQSHFTDNLTKELRLTVEELQRRSLNLLRAILMDYGRFRISTIDTFFQEILREFTRELGLRGGYRVEIETRTILSAAVRAVVVDLQREDGDATLSRWLTAMSLERISSGHSYDPIKDIYKLALELEREELKELSASGKLPSQTAIKALDRRVAKDVDSYISKLELIAEEVLSVVGECLGGTEPSRGKSGALQPFYKLSSGEARKMIIMAQTKYEPFPKYYQDAEDDIRKIVKKEDLKRCEAALLSSGLTDLFQRYRSHVEEHYTRVSAGIQMRKFLPAYGLIAYIDRKVKDIQADEHSILLADSSSLINKVIQDPMGVPFIFERLGGVLRHYMIDEFQDTSCLQYGNFRPLLEEGLSRGEESLIVGDVKQSIYRWRGSDSGLLSQSLRQDFEKAYRSYTLRHNWRSLPAIVDFNNALYRMLPEVFSCSYEGLIEKLQREKRMSLQEVQGLQDMAGIFRLNYETIDQVVPEQKRREALGAVVVHEYDYKRIHGEEPEEEEPIDSEEVEELKASQTLREQLPEVIADLQRRGYKPSDIAILVRTRAEATFVASILDDAGECGEYEGVSFEVVSNEALAPNKALSVRFVVAVLSYISKPDDRVAVQSVRSMYEIITGMDMAEEAFEELRALRGKGLYDLCEAVIGLYKDVFKPGELPYLIKLLDTAFAYQQDLAKDLGDFVRMWRERSDRMSLEIPRDEHKLTLMTIHKSKGLGFPVVLLPCLYWELLPSTSSYKEQILWCHNPYEEHPRVGMQEHDVAQEHISKVPVRLSPNLLKTSFAGAYIQEAIATSMDALNILYVATTRAKEELHMWVLPSDQASLSKEANNLLGSDSHTGIHKSIMGLLYQQIHMDRGALDSLMRYRPLGIELSSLNLPHKQSSKEEQDVNSTLTIKRIDNYDIEHRIEELKAGLEHFASETNRAFGTQMHLILSRIDTFEDAEAVVERAIVRGELELEKKPLVWERISTMMRNKEATRWFDGSGHHLRERDITEPCAVEGEDSTSVKRYRPDRIVLYPDNSAVVVDYKFGKEDEKYRGQVKSYMTLLRQIGFSPVKGYLWYLSGGSDVEEQDYIVEIDAEVSGGHETI